MTIVLRRAAPVLLLTLALALPGCGDDRKVETRKGGAEGEILPGSASDAMIALDTVRSQAPLAPRVVSSGKPGPGGGNSADAASGDTAETAGDSAAAEAPAPAATPDAE